MLSGYIYRISKVGHSDLCVCVFCFFVFVFFLSDLPYTKSLPVGKSRKMPDINEKVLEKTRIKISIYVIENKIKLIDVYRLKVFN